jgi:DNA-binding NarL/FixJ family response regulator
MLRVALAEDHAELRTTIRMFLGLLENIEVVFEATNGREAIVGIQQHQADVLVMDIMMPELNGLAAAKEIADLSLPTRVVLISTLQGIAAEQAAMAAGAHGFVCKDDLIQLLPVAIETVAQGGRFFTEESA